MNWTDLVLKCAQRGHQVMVSQKPTRRECFEAAQKEEFDAYMCIDSNAIFQADDVFKMFESPHDVTGAMMMSSDCHTLTCGRTMESLQHNTQVYVETKIDPSWMLLHVCPEGWNYEDPLDGQLDTRIRVGNRQVVIL